MPLDSDPQVFVSQMRNFFGLLPGQSLLDFGKEIKALSFQEKLEFADMLNVAGFPTQPPKPPSSSTT